ncbi:MAG: GntR family transcriptional regulator [Gemmatimonadales bacterium]
MTRDQPAGPSLQRSTTADQAAALLRQRILAGELPPGTPLREIPLSRSLGISRNTVREALRQLANEGLVRHSAHRGAVVTALSDHDITSIFEARRALELAATQALGGRKAEAGRALSRHADQLDAAVRARDPRGAVDADMAFHAALVDQLGSERLSAFYRKLLRELRLGLVLVDRRRGDNEQLAAEHRALARLVARGDRAKFRSRLEEHLRGSEERLRESVAQLEARSTAPRKSRARA